MNMKGKATLLVFLSVLVLTLMACQITGLIPFQLTASPTAAPQTTLAPLPGGQTDLVSQQDRMVAIYGQVSPGVVTIQTSQLDGTPVGLGSGWVYSADGYIVTNQHVVEGADKVEVDFPSGDKAFGNVVGTDLDSDLAVIKVDVPAAVLHPLTLGDSDQLKVGQIVVAIGNPFGLNGTMTTGIVSALGRALQSKRQAPGGSGSYFSAGDIIQTDAALNPGNSGGPLLNLNGEVVGVNRAIRTTSTTTSGDLTNSGIGFAISINIVKRVVPYLIQDGKYDYPYLGITSIDDLPLQYLQELALTQYTGAYVTSVAPGSPANQAGVRAGTQATSIQGLEAGGDLIIAIDGHTVLHFDDLLKYLFNNKSPGETVVLTVLRGDQQVDLTLTLGRRP
ncbi:MAG: trypsin-like peptidase domain-containing protein [Anaerolineales bacterium]|nr:trypsin-like peptidase domain-containing protein [Anaerolineales bacterium]